jgi:AraC-like DNA-binding protein
MRESTRSSHWRAVERVIEAFQQNLEQPLPLQNMARIAFASPFHFNRMFREVSGIPPTQFLYALRLQAAAHLLVTTDRSVLDICYEVGYNSLGTFTRRFTALIGISPTRLRGMSRTLGPEEFARELERSKELALSGQREGSSELRGTVHVSDDFDGVVLVGLFPEAIPQGRPVIGTLAVGGQAYVMSGVPDGEYYLFAAGLTAAPDPVTCFENRSVLRGGGQRIAIRDRIVNGSTDISLHAPAVTDPPILVTLPLLLREYLRSEVPT